MKPLLLTLLLLSAAPTASAADFRWTMGYGQGTLEANIENKNGSTFSIFCPQGSEDTTPGMFLMVDSIKTQPKEPLIVQIIVDGKNHPFHFDEIEYKAIGRANLLAFRDFVHALGSSKQKSFTVEFPKYNTTETFSLLDAKKALGLEKSKSSILEGCGEASW